jgi:hypothetical protein
MKLMKAKSDLDQRELFEVNKSSRSGSAPKRCRASICESRSNTAMEPYPNRRRHRTTYDFCHAGVTAPRWQVVPDLIRQYSNQNCVFTRFIVIKHMLFMSMGRSYVMVSKRQRIAPPTGRLFESINV